jgi:hypothetical protein
LRIYGKDLAGKLYASDTIVFSINGKKPPTVTLDIDAIVNARPYLPSDFKDRTYWKLYFHVSEPASWAAYSMDGGANQTVDSGAILRMAYGTYTIIVYAKDYCGNSGASAPYTFTLAPDEAGSAYAHQTPRPSRPSNWTPPSDNTAPPNLNNPFNQQTPKDTFPTALVAAVIALIAFVSATGVFLLKRTPMTNKR